jgi:rubrerythrin
MDIEFNAFEVFEIAERIERNGARFYRRAAELFDDAATNKMFLELANWEAKHIDVFANMRKQLSELSRELRTFKPENKILPDAQAMAGLAVFGIKPDPSDELSGKESKVDVLKKAIEKEKDSIVYYTGLKEFVAARAGKDKIDDIIKEEMHHISILSQSLQQREQLEARSPATFGT